MGRGRKGKKGKKELLVAGLVMSAITAAIYLALELALITGDIDVSGIVNPVMTRVFAGIQIDFPDVTISVPLPVGTIGAP